jgi:hypothetical protein
MLKNICPTKEMIYLCDPKVGKNLSDEEGRSDKGLINFQEARDEFLNFQVGNEILLDKSVSADTNRSP